MAKVSQKRKRNIQIVEYLISGGAYFWTGYLAFALFWSVLDWSLWWAKLGANLIGWTVNFLLQRYWVFKNPALKGHATEVTGRYIFITLVDFIMDYFIVYGLNQAGLTPYIGQFISAGFFTFWNYFWYRFWVFPEKIKRRRPAKTTTLRVVVHRAHGHSAYHTTK